MVSLQGFLLQYPVSIEQDSGACTGLHSTRRERDSAIKCRGQGGSYRSIGKPADLHHAICLNSAGLGGQKIVRPVRGAGLCGGSRVLKLRIHLMHAV